MWRVSLIRLGPETFYPGVPISPWSRSNFHCRSRPGLGTAVFEIKDSSGLVSSNETKYCYLKTIHRRAKKLTCCQLKKKKLSRSWYFWDETISFRLGNETRDSKARSRSRVRDHKLPIPGFDLARKFWSRYTLIYIQALVCSVLEVGRFESVL